MQPQQPILDIMRYESAIWSIADDYIAVGIKRSKFPEYMMPFFALVMLESRMRKVIKEIEQEEGITFATDPEGFKEAFVEKECGYNVYIVEHGKTLTDICNNDKSFHQDFRNYREGFDDELKTLLGINRGTQEEKFLNMDGIVAELQSKGILMTTVSKWAAIDLEPYDNSEITTLEEHIKRKWADISAETAGEQYTPSDIISLIAELVASKMDKPKNKYIHLYDPTCGGGNLLFGVADRLHKVAGYSHIATYGCDMNDALYALAAIESRFRGESHIRNGNTLTKLPFREKAFDVIVANPPYGIPWKGYEKEIRNDQTGQFVALPSVSDGQLLFMQHILWQLDEKGIAIEVNNGSSLFSGDAGSGESNIRKYLFEKDWVEAIIQMPSDEFFNTGIYTYLWVFNKYKAPECRNKVMLINASNGWELLKKSKGSKRRLMNDNHRKAVVDALLNFTDCEIGKVFPKWYFYYNKQALTLIEPDTQGRSVCDTICTDGKAVELPCTSFVFKDLRGVIDNNLSKEDAQLRMEELKKNYTSKDVQFFCENGAVYSFDEDLQSIVREQNGEKELLGCGKFVFKTKTSKKADLMPLRVFIEPKTTSDYEIIPYSPNEDENEQNIQSFLEQYVSKQYIRKDCTVGVELNFNKEFYVPEPIPSVDELLKEIEDVDNQLKTIQQCVTKGLHPEVPLKDSQISWLGQIPEHWEVKRMKELVSFYNGYAFKSETYDNEGTYTIVTIANVQSYGFDTTESKKITELPEDLQKEQILSIGDLLISMTGNVGRVCFVNQANCVLNQRVGKLVCSPKIYNKYLYYALSNPSFIEYLKMNSEGSAQQNASKYDICNFSIPLPPYDEQCVIVEYLDLLCAQIEQKCSIINQQIQNIQMLKRALINEVVTGQRTIE